MKVILVIGSPREKDSTSVALGNYLVKQLKAATEIEAETHYTHRAIRSEAALPAALAALAGAELVIFAAPVYVDSMPAPAIGFLERATSFLAESAARTPGQRFVALTNCGFPEAQHGDVMLEICRRFAEQTGFAWAGGLTLGGGEPLHGRPLEASGPMARSAMAALDATATALAQGGDVPPEADALMRKPRIQPAVYRRMGNLMWKRQAKKRGLQGQLRARPFQT